MKMLFRAYRVAPTQTSLLDEATEREMRNKALLPEASELLWEVTADTPEEASAIYHLRMGFEPFRPPGEWEPCPKCGAIFYPEGSGCCWRCGKIG